MTTYPPGELTPLGASLLADGTDAHLWYTSPDGKSQFYLSGALSPVAPGIPGQDGIVLKSIKGLGAPQFKHIDLQAAQQDGVTWTATVYDAAEIDLEVEAHAATPEGLSAVVDEWMGAWNPRNPGTLEYITPDGGYWYAQVRLMPRSWGDQYVIGPRRIRAQKLTHTCRIDNAFWYGMDSTDSFGTNYPPTITDNFSTPTESGLSDDWTVTYSTGHTGNVYVAEGSGVCWGDSGNSTQSAVCIYNQPTETDNQVVSITMGGNWEGFTLGGSAFNDIWARADSTGTNGIRCRIGWDRVDVSWINNGEEIVMWVQPILIPPGLNEQWSFVTGAISGIPRSYAVIRNGQTLFTFPEIDLGVGSAIGANYRYTGFGLQTAGGVLGLSGEAVPVPVAAFGAADTDSGSQVASGHIQLTNIGTEDGWPRYLAYGPGTFTIGNGPGSTTSVTFGPLLDGQRALITTQPRLRSVVDLSPGATTPATASAAQQGLLGTLLSFVSTNIAPLLDTLESVFGVLPAQTTSAPAAMYSLLSGRFTNPIPGAPRPSLATPVQIPVSITGGTAVSKIVAALTPMRISPTGA